MLGNGVLYLIDSLTFILSVGNINLISCVKLNFYVSNQLLCSKIIINSLFREWSPVKLVMGFRVLINGGA